MLATSLDKLAYLIVKAREFDVQVEPEGLEDGSNPSDAQQMGILEATEDNPSRAELRAALADLNDDEITEVLALVWVGRGDYDRGDWEEALTAARDAHDKRAISYLLGTPQLGDLLEQGLAELDDSSLPDEEGI